MRVVFMGTPEFAVPSLEQLIKDGHEVVGVSHSLTNQRVAAINWWHLR